MIVLKRHAVCGNICGTQKPDGRSRPMSAVLSAQEMQQYKEQGYLFPKYRLPAPLLGRLKKGIDRLLDTYTDVAQEDLANPHMIPPTEGAQLNPFMETARHAPILDMVEQVLGPDVVLWITRVLCKPPVKGREVPWHQDGEYWPMRPLATCSVWIAVDPGIRSQRLHAFHPGLAQTAGVVPAPPGQPRQPGLEPRTRPGPVRRVRCRERRTRTGRRCRCTTCA